MSNRSVTNFERSHTRFALPQLTSNPSVDSVNGTETYLISLTPEQSGNFSNIFYRINENENYTSEIIKSKAGENTILVRAEEVTLVVIILILWMVAIGLFVHRWGKIRMLEPYQPDYKHIHEASCPLNPSISPTHGHSSTIVQRPRQPLPTYRVLPRKSSSLCFTPSMLQSGQNIPPAWKVCIPQFDSNSVKGLSPASIIALRRLRGRLGSDAHIYHDAIHSEQWYKAHSAENLRHIIITNSPGKSDENITNYSKITDEKDGKYQDVDSIDINKGKHPLLLDVVSRGMSLDSSVYGLRRSSPAVSSWSTGMGISCPFPEGRTTPEIRISPTPDFQRDNLNSINKNLETSIPVLHCSQARPHGIQRQETVKEESTPYHYTTMQEADIAEGEIPNTKKEVYTISQPLNKFKSVSSEINRKGTLKKDKVINSRWSDDTLDTPV